MGVLLFLSLICFHLSSDSLDLRLEHFVSKLVEKDESIRNCVLAINYNNSYFWAGASGIAVQESQTSMTKDTPFYISSITKLYTATAVMKLYEQNELSLDDPISNYISMSLIQGIGI